MKNKDISTSFKEIWNYANKNPILTAIILSVATFLSIQLIEFYKTFYWIYYFIDFKIPLVYFKDSMFFYSFDLILAIIFCVLLYSFGIYRVNKIQKFSHTPIPIPPDILTLILIFISILLIDLMGGLSDYIDLMPPFFFLFTVVCLYRYLVLRRKINKSFNHVLLFLSSMLMFIMLSLSFFGLSNVVNIKKFRTIENNHVILLETESTYFTYPYVMKNKNIYISTTNYQFVDKVNTLVTYKEIDKIYVDDELVN